MLLDRMVKQAGRVVAGASVILCMGTWVACGGETNVDAERLPPGQQEEALGTGSCLSSTGAKLCGGKGNGNCYCDATCVKYGDCCPDKANVCDAVVDPCASLKCGTHSTCKVENNQAACICDAGYVTSPDGCVLETTSTWPVACTGGTCPAEMAVCRLYQLAVRGDGLINPAEAVRLSAFLKDAQGNSQAGVLAFLQSVMAAGPSRFSGNALAILQSYVNKTPANWVPLQNDLYRVQPGTNASSVMDDNIYLLGVGSKSGDTDLLSYSRGYAKMADGVLRFSHGSRVPAYPNVSTSAETSALQQQSPGQSLDKAAAVLNLTFGGYGFEYKARNAFYDPKAPYWAGLCHAWTYAALDNRLNALIEVEGDTGRKGVWLFGQWISRADLGNWAMAVANGLSVGDAVLVDPFVTPKDWLLGVTQWVMRGGTGLRADMFNDVEDGNGTGEIWNQPVLNADMTVEDVPDTTAEAVIAHARKDPKNWDPIPANSSVKLVRIEAVWGAESNDNWETSAYLKSSTWNMYFVTDTDGRVVVGYQAHHLAKANVGRLEVTTSDPLPDYFAYPKHEVVDAAFKGVANTMLDNANEGPHMRFFIAKVLAYGIDDATRKAFETAYFGNTPAEVLKAKFAGIANAYSAEQWQRVFATKLGPAKDFGAVY